MQKQLLLHTVTHTRYCKSDSIYLSGLVSAQLGWRGGVGGERRGGKGRGE